MATLSAVNPTLLDLAKRMDPDGKIATIVELLNQDNEILTDMSWIEGNLPTGNRSTIRTGISEPTWRKLYGRVQPTKSTTASVDDTCGMLEAYAEVDAALVDLQNNAADYRFSEDLAHLEGFNQQLSSALFYASEKTTPEKFTGFAPRFNDLAAENGEQIIDAGGTGTDNQSIWLIGWGPRTVHGIIPKGSKAGWQMTDKGQVTSEDSNGLMEVYRTHYRWDAGLTVRDWRYIVRIANIDKSLLTKDASAGADLIDLMTEASEQMQSFSGIRPAWYGSRTVRTFLRRQIVNKVSASTLTEEKVAGKRVVMFDEIPFRRVDTLSADEARVV